MEETKTKTEIKYCRFYIQGKCNHGDSCKFVHDKEICRNYYLKGQCKHGDKCKFKHVIDNISTKNNNSTHVSNNDRNKHDKNHGKKRHHPKNTENFNPSHKPSDMVVHVGIPDQYTVNDVIIYPNLINEPDMYDKLLGEMEKTGIDDTELWKLWHGDSHFIADDNLNYKEKVPTFGKIINRLEETFKMDVKSTRFNWYKDSEQWKPFHHDAAAVKEHIAKVQNFTVGISLGATREIAFENAKTKSTVSFVLPNGSAYAFSKDININWKHGIPQIPPEKKNNEGRISIIAWGYVNIP
jgi:hypothetical protein